MDISIDHEGVTVHAIHSVHRKGPVFYASLPCDIASPVGQGTNAGTKGHLVSILWNHLMEMESHLWKRSQSCKRTAFPIKVVHDPLGKPHFLLGEYCGPAISFSEGGGRIWAALCGVESDVGIDVAEAGEFLGEYPFQRVFHPQELQHALRLTGGDLENGSALLWSIKEAVVKALGCAFHLVDPLELTVCPSSELAAERAAGGNNWYTFSVRLSGKALVRFPTVARVPLWVRSLPQRNMWLSIALLNWQYRCGDE